MTDTRDIAREAIELAEKATPGPWRVEQDTTLIWGACDPDDKSSYGMGYPVAQAHLHLGSGSPFGRERRTEEGTANADFLAFAREALPTLARALLEAEDRIEKQKERIETLERLDREAATHVESVICLRTGFTGEPPYVGWEGLGLALNEALDARDEANREVINLMRDKAVAESQSATLSQRVAELEGALRECQGTLASLINPKGVSGVGIATAWANCVAAEAKARATLSTANTEGEKNG